MIALLPKLRFRFIIVTATILLELVLLIFTILHPENDNFRKLSQFIQIAFCVWVLTTKFSRQINALPNDVAERMEKIELIRTAIPVLRDKDVHIIRSILENTAMHIKQLINLLLSIWVTWGVFFVVALVRNQKVLDNNIGEVLEVFANLVPCVMFYLCYKKLSNPEINTSEEIRPAIFGIVLFSIFHGGILFFFKGFSKEINYSFYLLSGIFNAVFIAMLASRLQSKIINAPIVFIWAMYFYAAIQPLVFITNMQVPNEKWITEAADIRLWLLGIGKCFFYLFMLWIFESKRLVNYFIVNPFLAKDVDEFDRYKGNL